MGINKVQYGNTVLIDLTNTTVSADKLMQGYTAIDRTGTLITGTATGGGDEYIRTVICPQQTVSDSSRMGILYNFTDNLVDGEFYIVTYDGTEYVCTAETMWETTVVMGDYNIIFDVPSDPSYPFAIGQTENEIGVDVAMLDTNQHTVKIEHLEFIEDGTTLVSKSITANGTYNASSDSADGYSSVTVNVPTGTPTLQTKTKTYTPTTSQQTESVSADSGYDGIDTVNITVNAMPSGTAGTPTATKGTVSNHSVSVTPSVTNQTGYITGSTKTGTAVTVSASELVSGNLPITQNGNNIDCANYSTVSVNVSGGSSMNYQVAQSTSRASSSTYTNVISLTCNTAGKYDIYWDCFRSSTSGTSGSQLYINGNAQGTANTAFTNHIQNNHSTNVTLAKNDVVAVYARSRGNSYYAYVGTLTIKQTA